MTDSENASPPAAVRETHISTVFFVGDRVYKLKKPIKLDFLDFSTVEAREQACRREVALNQRLAPDAYLGVAEVRDVDGRTLDHLVVMRRMPDRRRLSTLVRQHQPFEHCLREVARVVATFHAQAETSAVIASAGSVEHVRARWESSFATMAPFVGVVLDPDTAGAVEQLARRYLDGRGPLFAQRVEQQKVRDGHGDLLADDIFCLDDGPRILDCIEFDDQLRYGDVLADVAFLAMDLERVGAPDAGARFLAWYREFAGETYPETLAHHYIAYRAHVRAKVACLRVGQGDATAADDARQLLQITSEHLLCGRVGLTLVGGLPGTGKSTLAAGLSDRLGWVMLRSDEVRKDLASLGHTAHGTDGYRDGLYNDRATAATYRVLLERARRLLEVGEAVILDASWTDARWREEARAMANDTFSDLRELRCVAPIDVVRERLASRASAGTDPSDATSDIAARMTADASPWPTATVIDTSCSREDAVAGALDAVTQLPHE
jgi:uncharacterized protein